MTDEAAQRRMDAEEHQKIYSGIMRRGSEIGVPFALALSTFFTSLTMANGFLVSLIAGIVVYLFVFFVVKTFFSH